MEGMLLPHGRNKGFSKKWILYYSFNLLFNYSTFVNNVFHTLLLSLSLISSFFRLFSKNLSPEGLSPPP